MSRFKASKQSAAIRNLETSSAPRQFSFQNFDLANKADSLTSWMKNSTAVLKPVVRNLSLKNARRRNSHHNIGVAEEFTNGSITDDMLALEFALKSTSK